MNARGSSGGFRLFSRVLSGTQVGSIAHQTIREGLRMKIALVFFVLIAVILLGLPFSITGDSTLTGAVQSFMTYSLSATSALLGILTVFLSRSLSDELVNKQIFLVMTKPIPRWQFVLGKWLGITLLNGTFLAFSALVMYGMVHYIRATMPPLEERYDKAELMNEVLVARHSLKPRIPDFRKPAELEMQKNLEEGLYANVPDFKPEAEIARLMQKYEARYRVVGPLQERIFEFENVLVDRTRSKELQIRYKADVSRYPPDEIFRASWHFGNPLKDTPVYDVAIRHAVGRYHTVRFPVEAVAKDKTLTVRFVNVNPFDEEPIFRNVIDFRASDEVEVLFQVGSFEGNLFRLIVINFCKLIFLAAVAILATTIFSFPVASLVSFTVYVLAGVRVFLAEALDFASHDAATMFTSFQEFAVRSIGLVYYGASWLVPDFGKFDAVETFVNGRNVSLVWVLQAITELSLLRTLLILGLAMLLFHRREVAEVSA